MKPHKYKAKSVTVDNILFPSKREASRYGDIKIMLKAGVIQDLTLHPKFPCIVNGLKVCTYIADFSYVRRKDGEVVTEDCKGYRTDVYRLKKKLVEAIYGIRIIET